MSDLDAISEILSDLIRTAEEIDEVLLAYFLKEAKGVADEALARRNASSLLRG